MKNFKENIYEKSETKNECVFELMTKYPELSQTFEYILYSNKYKHTLTDVFNIIKMLMFKLEELQKHDVDIKNTLETINHNYKIKGLVQSTAINLSHVVDQLNVNETTFLDFAKKFSPLKIVNDSEIAAHNSISGFSGSSQVLEEPLVSSSLINNQLDTPENLKTEHIRPDASNKNIFDKNHTIVLTSDDEYEETINYDGCKEKNFTVYRPKNNEEDLENYVIGSDFKDILSDHDSNYDVVSSPKQSQVNTTSKFSSGHKTPLNKVKKIKPKVSDEAIDEARKADLHLRKRLSQRNSEMLSIVKKFNLQSNDIVLEFNKVSNKPLITIHKELAKVLKKHQVEGIRFLWDIVFESVDRTNSTDGTGCILAHRMGIGKTLQIITLLYTVIAYQSLINLKTFLIVCPPGLIYNWMDEIYKWLKDIDKDEVVKVFDLPKTNKLYNITNIATWKSKGGILIISYENFKSLVNCNQSDLCESFSHALIDPGPDVVILDEGHYIKNTNTKLLKSLSQIRTKRRIILTGTPMQNSLKEYFTMVDFVKPNILGNFGKFTTTFIKPIDSGQFIDSSDEAVQLMKQRTFILHKLLQNTVHRIDDKNLKPLFTDKIEYTLEVNMTDFQCELYEKFLQHNKTTNDRCNVFLRLHVLTLITLHPLTLYRLLHYRNSKQPEFGTKAFDDKFAKDLPWIANYGEDPRFFEAKQSHKISYVLNTIKECQKRKEKMVCFLKSPLALDALEYFLQKEQNWVSGDDYFRMDGKTPMNIRNQMCEAFNNSENPVKMFILSMGTGVLGYNMVGANRVLLLNTSWNPSNDLQAIYRCLRFGQKKTVYVNRLLAKGTVEPKAYYRQISKLGMASSVVDLQHMSRKVSFDQTNDLFTFDSSKNYYTTGVNTKDPVLNQIIKYNYKFISDLKEHDSMLVESVEEQLTLDERKILWTSFKNNELGTKNLIKPKPLHKLLNTEHQNQVINKKIKQEINDNVPSTSNSHQPNKQQISSPIANESHYSKIQSYFNNPLLPSPKCTAKRKFPNLSVVENTTTSNKELKNNTFHKKSNRFNNDEPIQNQFRNFQNRSFSHHKRYPTANYRPHMYSKEGVNSRDLSHQNQQFPIPSKNQTWHSNQYKPTGNNFQNRSGMSK
uniref:Helicase ARIP4 n=1 Tax=Sipha flava TaxID=143950 RepID=A0A2S2QV59_9HEMI